MSSIKALTRRLLNLIEASDENYSDVYYNANNIDQLLKDKSITAIKGLSTYGTNITQFPMQVTYIAEQCNIDGHGDTILELPKNLTIGGTLYIGPYSKIKQLPKGLKVGSLGLHSRIITELPDDLQIKNTLNISAPVKRVENISCKHVILNNSHIKIIRNVHAAEYLRIDIGKSQSLKIYPDVICDGGITIAYKDEIYEFQDILEVYIEFPELALDEFKPFDYSDEDMESTQKSESLVARLSKLVETSDENYSDVVYNKHNIDQLFKNKSITKIKSLNTIGAEGISFPMHVTYIAGDCYISRETNISKLPENLTVDGELNIGYGTKIDQLPKGLKVGSLIIQNKLITELPNDLQVKNTLRISAPVECVENVSCNRVVLTNSHLQILRNVHVADYLHIQIEEPQSLKIYPDVTAGQKIVVKYYSDSYRGQEFIFQDATELYTEFPQFAPDEFKPFDYSDEDMKNFEKTEKNENLISRLYALTEDIGGDYNKDNINELLTNRNITEINSFSTIGAEIYRFPRQVHYIAGDCWIDEYCGIAELPDDLTIGGALTINYSKALDMLPDGLKVGSLRLWSHIVTEIPDDLQVSHNLDITAPVKKVENFSCNNVYLFNKGELTHLKNVHAKGTLTIYLYENRPLTIYPDVTADKGIIAYYIYENHKSQTYNFADVTELYAEFPQLAPDEFKPFDYSDEDME